MHLQKTVGKKSLAFQLAVVRFWFRVQCSLQTKQLERCQSHVRFPVVGVRSFNVLGCIKVQGLEKNLLPHPPSLGFDA